MTRTTDFADGLTTDCKVCFYVMTKGDFYKLNP